MGLQLILGASGQGKTQYLMDQVIEESMKNPSQRYYILVPEQFGLEMQKQMVERHPDHGFSNIDILSFYRLAYLVFDECSYQPKEILEDLGVSMILKKILMDHEEELLYFKKSMKYPGFLDELKSMIMEFTNYSVTAEDMENMSHQLDDHKGLSIKCLELSKICRWFQEAIQEHFMVSGQILDVLLDMVDDSCILKDSIFYLDGYTGFTPIQLKFLKKLLGSAKEVVITVTIPYLPNGNRKMAKEELFSFGEKTVYSLWDLCKENGTLWHEPLLLQGTDSPRFGDNKEMAHMERYIFHGQYESYEDVPKKVHAISCKNIEDEAEFVLHKIEGLVRSKGYRYQDFAILMGNESDYPWAMIRKSKSLGIPLFVDSKQKMSYHSGVETIRALLHLAQMDYSYQSVFRYLKSGMSDFSGLESDFLENYIISSGIRGLSMWKKPFYRRLHGLDEDKIACLDLLRCRLLQETQYFVESVKDKNLTVKDKMTVLYETLCQLHFSQKLKEKAKKAEADNDFVKAMGYKNFFKEILALMDKIVAIFGQEEMEVEELSELLDAGLETLELASPPLSMDQVILGDLKRTRLPEIKVLFFVGMNDGDMPPIPEDQGILTDEEKRILEENGVALSLNLTERVLEDEYYMYLAFSKPQEEIYFSYSLNASDGSSKRPSALFDRFKKLFPKLKILSYPDENGERRYYYKEKDSREYLIRSMRQYYDGKDPEDPTFYALLAYWQKHHPEELQEIYERMDQGLVWMPLKEEIVEGLYGEEIAGSVTRLESFAACPYRYYCDYGLRLSQREEYQIHPVDLGNLFHSALEYYSRHIKEEGYQWKDIPEDVQEKLIEEAVDAVIDENVKDVMDSSRRNQYKRKMIGRILRKTVAVLKVHLQNSSFEPDRFEMHFGDKDQLQASNIALANGHRMSFQGTIDRIDICEEDDKVYVKIIDYKSGSKKFDFKELYYGLQLQLVMYLNAALEIYAKEKQKQVEPAGIFYYHIQDPIAKSSDLAGKNPWKGFQLSGYLNEDEDILHRFEASDSEMVSFSLIRNKDGSPKKGSHILSSEDFFMVGDYVRSSMKKMGERIYAGEIAAQPYRSGDHTACKYCPYDSVCGFEEGLPGHLYRTASIDNKDVLEQIRKEVN